MLKKIITTGLLGVSALAVMMANAATLDNNNVSNTVKNHKKQNIAARKSQMTSTKVSDDENSSNNDNIKNDSTEQSSFQATSLERSNGGLLAGFYVNGQVGYADTHMNKLPSIIGSGLSNNGLAGRLALGYKFNQNYAVEVGYLQLPEGKGYQNKAITLFNKQSAIDIAGKASFPVTHNVNFYGKLGVAYLTTNLEAEHGNNQVTNINDEFGIAKHKWAPEAVVGMGYDVTPNVTVDTSFTHIHPWGSDRPGAINFLAVGLGYTFG